MCHTDVKGMPFAEGIPFSENVWVNPDFFEKFIFHKQDLPWKTGFTDIVVAG